jgi:hypothetical protein
MPSASSRAEYGDISEDPGAALFEALEDQHAGGEVDPVDGQRQRLGQPTDGIGQGHAEGAHRPISPFGCAQKGVALADGQIFANPSWECNCMPIFGLGEGILPAAAPVFDVRVPGAACAGCDVDTM